MKEQQFDQVIESGKAERHYWLDLWNYRELFYILAWRDIAVRYKQTLIGISWAILRPIITMMIFVVVFGKIAKLPSEGVPYPIFVFAALLPWAFFSSAFGEASNSLVGNANLISKVYFPRLIIPAATIIVAIVDFLISFLVLLVLMLWYQYLPSWHILFVPIFLAMAFLLSLGTGLYVTALNVRFRDFRYIIPFIIQLGLYASPVGFSSSIVPEKYQLLYYLNPMVGIIDGFRWSLSGGTTSLNISELVISMIVISLFCFLGIYQFRKTEKSFADII